MRTDVKPGNLFIWSGTPVPLYRRDLASGRTAQQEGVSICHQHESQLSIWCLSSIPRPNPMPSTTTARNASSLYSTNESRLCSSTTWALSWASSRPWASWAPRAPRPWAPRPWAPPWPWASWSWASPWALLAWQKLKFLVRTHSSHCSFS